MQHLVVFLILFPLISALFLLLPPCGKNVAIRRISACCLSLITLAISLIVLCQVIAQGPISYAIGNWQAPFGIVLLADQLAVILTSLTAFLTCCCVLYSCAGDDNKGNFFHPLVQFLMMGVNGAFLTGDIFNLFVFFEVLLIASYALLMHAGDKQNTRAALHYVVINLIGSAIFLIALGTLYGVVGSLNMVDMANKISQLTGDDVYIAKIGGSLLLIVFALKAALLPLHLWLPNTYSTAMPVIAALFAIMTKVGIYSLLRVYNLLFAENSGQLAAMGQNVIWIAALATIVVGAIGVLASQNMRKLVSNLVLVSVGTLAALVSLQQVNATAAAIYYLVHSTLVCAALFLLVDLIARQRGKVADRITTGRAINQPFILGFGFFIAALSVIGMPPLSGFVGKIWILKTTYEHQAYQSFWPVYLTASLILLIAITRAGSIVFWQNKNSPTDKADVNNAKAVHPAQLVATYALVLASPLMVIFAKPLTKFCQDAAMQLHNIQLLTQTVGGLS
ncbi:monovalent cation/H+ antiporter subunit D [Catenovulum adriaticum]|uniref:Monovalent cation/H+ antiporter subunit D n=1 Tax=Catenovulum adriaticum TaxID=2984846 RepID=A0ABY7AUJ8_9ALTE|nr:monovalent cation/H+ antiporter subunit D [Catenovulum sp. TS8]WAJ72447.1 monovalent cation/H+ antiporter subunit D [Catenovulum sp. TS8]